jgi:hypothetical protein
VAHEVEDDDRCEDRQGNRDQNDQGRPPRAQKQQDHQPREPRRDRSLAQHAGDRCGDELRLIDELVDTQTGRRRRAGGLQDLADAFDDCDGRGIAVLEDAQQDGASAIVAHDVLLHRPAVVHLADVLEEHGLAIEVFDRNVVEIGDAHGHRIGAHRVLCIAELGETRGQSQVLGVDRVHDIRRGQASCLKLQRIDIDHDLPGLAAVWGWKGHTLHRGKLLAQVVDPVVVELLLVETVGAKAQLQYRNTRGIVRNYDRRLDAHRHQGADCIRRRHDLSDGEVEVDVGLEGNLLHRDAVESLRFHVLDAGHASADRVLAVGGDALLHLRHAQAGVLPDHRHHRNVDLREDVLRHDHDGRAAEKHDKGGHDVKGVRKFQRKSNDAHVDLRVLARFRGLAETGIVFEESSGFDPFRTSG